MSASAETRIPETARATAAGREINRSLSKANFRNAAEMMPVDGPGAIKDRQDTAYTWAILADSPIRG